MTALPTIQMRVRAILANRQVSLALGVAISALTLYLALRNVDASRVVAAISSARPGFLALTLGSIAANTVAKAARWRVLLGRNGRQFSLGQLLESLLIGQMLNTLYPARIGDLARAGITGGQAGAGAAAQGGAAPGGAFTLGTILLEKLVDTAGYVLLFFLLLAAMPLPAWLNQPLVALAVLVAACIALVFGLSRQPGWLRRLVERGLSRLPEKARQLEGGNLQAGLASLAVMQEARALTWIGIWTAASWGTAILNNWLVLQATGIHLPWTAAVLSLIVLQAGISLPSVPGKIGVFEYACVLSLALFGVPAETALSYGILLHILVLFPTTLLGLFFFLRLSAGRRRQLDGGKDELEPAEGAADSHGTGG